MLDRTVFSNKKGTHNFQLRHRRPYYQTESPHHPIAHFIYSLSSAPGLRLLSRGLLLRPRPPRAPFGPPPPLLFFPLPDGGGRTKA